MRELKEDYHCDACRGDFSQPYPVAESRDEYEACRRSLAGGYVVNDTGQARRKISCPNPQCRARISVIILDQKRA
jgi:hypothetical protein